MTKLVVVLAVVIVVIVVIVIIAARSMRAEDPAEFTDRPGGRGPSRGGQDNRDARYERRERHPGRGGRPSQRQGGSPARPAGAGAGRGVDDRRDQRRTPAHVHSRQDRGPWPGGPPRGDPATGRRGPVPGSGALDHSRPLAAAPGEPRLSRHADAASLPSPGRGIPQGRPPVPPDDDPLTSPSFPRIPASDSRAYRNGRADTPPRGSSPPSPYLAPAPQFPSYGSPAPHFRGGSSRRTDTTHPNAHRPDLLPSRDASPRSALPAPARPAPPAPPAAGSPSG